MDTNGKKQNFQVKVFNYGETKKKNSYTGMFLLQLFTIIHHLSKKKKKKSEKKKI